jgi:glutathione S-transferase
MNKPILIYGVPFSVHTRKVILTARIKSIPYELKPVVPVIPDNPPANWRSISPTGLIPAIDDEGFVLADSTAIVHYLEKKVPEPAVLPSRPKELATALFLDAWAGSALFRDVIHPLFHQRIVAPNIRKVAPDQKALDAASKEAAPSALAYLESRAPERFLVGDALSIADLAVVSNLILFHYLGQRIDANAYPQLAVYFQRHRDSSLVAAALAIEKPFVDGIAGLESTF